MSPHSHLTASPPPTSFLVLSFPAPRVLLLTMSRESALNCTNSSAILEITHTLTWFDNEPALSVAVLTGAGQKAFSTGADLKEWEAKVEKLRAEGKSTVGVGPGDIPGAAAISNRNGKKPIVAAVNGMALGGGFENVVNCDVVIASEGATFGLVEGRRGLAPYAGVLPRLIRTVGLQRASELALTCRVVGAELLKEWGLVNKIVRQEDVVPEAVRWAEEIAEGSPDSIICTLAGLRQGWQTADAVEATNITKKSEWARLQMGGNMQEGLAAFKEKRKPVWKAAKL